VSIGQGSQRRTVVYLAATREMAHSPSTAQRTFFGRGRGRRTKRPDQALYVPGALRRAKFEQHEQSLSRESPKDNVESEISSINSDPRLMKENNEADMENVTRIEGDQAVKKELKSEVLTTTAEDSSMVIAVEDPNSLHVRGERKDRNSECSVTEDQNFGKHYTNNESDCRKHIVVDSDSESSLACGSISSKSTALEDALTAVYDNCRDSNDKHLEKNEGVKVQDYGVSKSDTNKETLTPRKEMIFKNHSFQDGTSLKANKDSNFSEKKIDTKNEPSLTIDCGTAEKPEGHQESWTESNSINGEGDKVLTTCSTVSSTAFGPKRKQAAKNIEITHEHAMLQSASSSGMTQECIGSNSTSEGLSLQPSSTQTGMFVATGGDLSNNDSPNGQRTTDSHPQGLLENVINHSQEDNMVTSSPGDQSSTVKGEMIDMAGLRTSDSVSEKAENSGNDPEVITETTITNGELASQSTALGLAHSSQKIEGSEAQLEVIEEKYQATSGKNEGGLDSGIIEIKEHVDELQSEVSKISKKKKSKKDKTKSDQGEEKTRSKEKGEKKKKKEKKHAKNDEQVVDTEVEITEGKKSKTKDLSSKEKNEKGPNVCIKDSGKGLPLASCSNDCDGGDLEDDDDWETNFDESGDCLNQDQLEELSRLTGITDPEVHKTQFDFYSFTPNGVELDDEDFGHIVEIYNFSPELKTQDIMQALSSFRSKGFDIKWVDDTHALGIFSSPIAAQEAIRLCSSPLMKLRPISQGTLESRKKASNCFEFLQPYKERPQTSKLLADRLVTGALGMRSKMTREERVREREKIKEAKNKKEQEKIQKAQIWGD